MIAVTAAPPTEACALRPCTTPLAVRCDEPATHIVLILEPGMHLEPAAADVCEAHAAELIDGGMAEGLDVIQ